MAVPPELGPFAEVQVVAARRRPLHYVSRAVAASASVLALLATLVVIGREVAAKRGSWGRGELLSWDNSYDDGRGVLGGQQHGVSEIITSCDADDPACTFQTSKNGYAHGQWVSNLNTQSDRRMEVNVRSDLRQGSSYEDDIGEGPLAGMHKTDEKGKFEEWTPRPLRFREREYSRVKVGVPDGDGMDSWEHWRSQNPERAGHGNLPAHPSQYSTTSENIVFRGPLVQPREVAPVDQNYDMTDINSQLPEATSATAGAATSETVEDGIAYAAYAAAPSEIVKDGIVYVPLSTAPAAPVPAPAMPGADKAAHLLKALQDVAREIQSSEAEYSEFKNQLEVLQKSNMELESKAQLSKDHLKNLADEEARILDAMGDKKSDCDPCHQKEISEAPVAEVAPSEPQPAPEPLEAPPQAEAKPQAEAEPQAEPETQVETPVEAPVEAPPQAEVAGEAEPPAAPPVDTAFKSMPPANAMRSSTLALKR